MDYIALPARNAQSLDFGVRALDDLQGPRAMNGKASLQLGPGMATIGEDIALPGEDTALKPAATPTVAVLDVGQRHISCDQQHAAIDQDMTLPTFGLGIKDRCGGLEVVLRGWWELVEAA